ncbi:MAG: winged helix-turn-helix transcriptional regulator [Nitrososphaerota archaeon]
MALGETVLTGGPYRVLQCKWSLPILSQLAGGPLSFSTLAKRLTISNRVLADKLRRLSALSLVQFSGPGQYGLTRDGYNLIETVEPLLRRGVEPNQLGEILKCKWMREIIRALLGGPLYSSEIKRRVEGLSWKVLSQRLGKLVRMGFVSREIIPLRPVRVRYALTNSGRLTAYWLLTASVRDYLPAVLPGPPKGVMGFVPNNLL